MTAKRSHPRIPILLRLEPEELARIDIVRGKTPRTQWIINACMCCSAYDVQVPASRV